MLQPRTNGFFRKFRSRPARDAQLLSVQGTREILENNVKSIDSIRQSAGISDRLFGRLYLHPISRISELLQSCPASGSDHHAWPGGLVSHILESCAYALRFRKGIILPVGATPEQEMESADLFTYTVFAATLLHDIGAALEIRRIALHDRRGRYLREWDPLLADIDSEQPRARYMKIEYRPAPASRFGRTSSLMYVNRILPGAGLRWLRSDPEAYSAFLNAFSETPAGPVHRLAEKGKQASVAGAAEFRNDPSPGTRPGRSPANR